MLCSRGREAHRGEVAHGGNDRHHQREVGYQLRGRHTTTVATVLVHHISGYAQQLQRFPASKVTHPAEQSLMNWEGTWLRVRE